MNPLPLTKDLSENLTPPPPIHKDLSQNLNLPNIQRIPHKMWIPFDSQKLLTNP